MRIYADKRKAWFWLVAMAAFACDRMPATGSKANLESDWSAKLSSYTDGIAMLHSCGKLVIWLSQSCDLIGAWKFLSAGPRILPKFTRPFSSSRVGSGHETNRIQTCHVSKPQKAALHLYPLSSFWGWGLGTRLRYTKNARVAWGRGYSDTERFSSGRIISGHLLLVQTDGQL